MPLGLETAAGLAGVWALTQWRARVAERRAEAAFPPEGQLLDIDGRQVHAVVMGQGPDVVLIHGASGNTRDMTFALAPRLAERYRVIVLDRPGFGYTESGPHRAGGDIVQQSALLQRAAAHLDAARPIVIGHSYGGAVALAWAVHHPHALSGLVPLSAASNPWEGGLSTYYRVLSHPVLGRLGIPALTAFVPQSKVRAEVESVFHPDPMPPGYPDHFGAALSLRRRSMRDNALQRAALLEEIRTLSRSYPDISVPVEVVHGAADTTVPLSIHADPLARAVPGAVLTCLPGVGHMPHHADPQAVIAAIDRVAQRAGLHAGA